MQISTTLLDHFSLSINTTSTPVTVVGRRLPKYVVFFAQKNRAFWKKYYMFQPCSGPYKTIYWQALLILVALIRREAEGFNSVSD